MSIIRVMRQGLPAGITLETEIKELQFEFAADFDLFTVAESSKQDIIINMVIAYSKLSYLYLYKLGSRFESDKTIKEYLTVANSIIAEACREIKLPYFHIDGGYSIIDKGVAFCIDTSYFIEPKDVLEILEEMMTPEETSIPEIEDEASN